MNYKTKRWKKLREKILMRDGYMCQISKRYGKRIQADTVHHIFPADKFPEYQWEPWNLISLSGSVHNTMHVRDTQELTGAGLELMKRTARQRNIRIDD
jgi:5-methylcytosine-specific restriction endonuclease McrA